MRRTHLERFRPICPHCREKLQASEALELTRVESEDAGDVLEGVLLCGRCQCEYPILDGIPVISANLRELVAGQIDGWRARTDMSPHLMGLIGDCAGPGSAFDATRSMLSSYSRGHYGDLDSERRAPREHSLVSLFDACMDLLPEPPTGPWLDFGCSVGRATFELASRTDDLVLGIDLNLSMLRVARHILRTGEIDHPLRRVGIVYDQRRFPVDFPGRERVDFWACDAMSMPFTDGCVTGATSFNLLDCLTTPGLHVRELARVLSPGSPAVLTTPYDWNASVTPLESWFGGHSQRGPSRGDSATELRRILTGGIPEVGCPGLTVVREADSLPWSVYVHERASMSYAVHAVVAAARSRPAEGTG